MINMNFTSYLISLAIGALLSLVCFWAYTIVKKHSNAKNDKALLCLAYFLLVLTLLFVSPLVITLVAMLSDLFFVRT